MNKVTPVLVQSSEQTVYKQLLSPLKNKVEIAAFTKPFHIKRNAAETVEDYARRQAVIIARYTGQISIVQIVDYVVPALEYKSSLTREWSEEALGPTAYKEWNSLFVEALHRVEIKQPAALRRLVVAVANPFGIYTIHEHVILGHIHLERTSELLDVSKPTIRDYFYIDSLQKVESTASHEEIIKLSGQLKIDLAEAILQFLATELQ